MDIVDRDLEKAARAASPDRFPSDRGGEGNNMRRVGTAVSSVSSATTSSASIVREEMGMSRVQTQRDLERHPTAISRIHTQRSQHSATVGRTLRSRESRKPLPEFGGGKPYPAALPEREEYVVEFDGPDDPLHAQNWPLRKKYAWFRIGRESKRLSLTGSLGCLRRRYSVSRHWCLHSPAVSSPPPH